MISPVSSAVLTGGIVATSNLVNHKGASFRQLAGVGVYAIILAAINEAEPVIASRFALLVLVGVTFTYVPSIIKATGLNK